MGGFDASSFLLFIIKPKNLTIKRYKAIATIRKLTTSPVNLPQQELGASLPIATLIAVALCLVFLDAQHKREFPFHPYLYMIRNSLVTRYHFSLHTSFVKKEISLLTPLPISSL